MRHLNIQASDKGKLPMTWEEKSKMYKKPNRVFEGGDSQQWQKLLNEQNRWIFEHLEFGNSTTRNRGLGIELLDFKGLHS